MLPKSLRRVLAELKPFRVRVGVILFLGIVISSVQPFAVRLTQQVIDSLKSSAYTDALKGIPLFLVLLFAVSGLAKYFHNTIRKYISEKVVLRLREDLFKQYVSFPIRSLDGKKMGDLLSVIQNDLLQISTGLDTLCDVLREPFTFLGLIAMALYFDWRLTLITLVVAPLVAYLFSRSGAAVKRYSQRNLDQLSNLISLSQEAISGSRIVRVFQLESVLQEKFKSIQEKYFQTFIKSARVQELATPAVEFIGACLVALIIVYGGYRVENGLMSAGDLIAFVLAIGLAQMPIKKLNNAFLKLKVAEAAADRVFALLDTRTLQSTGGIQVLEFRDSIRFERVWLYYDEKLALRDLSLEVRRGECIGLVGKSGSGKSSVVNLLCRLYDVSKGRILIDGTDTRHMELDSLRKLISFVTQDTFLFNDSIYENIRFGKVKASSEEVWYAAKLAHCLDFIERCPKGIDTSIGDRGLALSGGERQRVAIARAILKNAPILVLDEATSNLDSQSERVVQQAIDSLMKGKTTFLVAHRFSTLQRVDRIWVLDNGKIIEQGPHIELVKNRGTYFGLYQQQFMAEI